MKSQTETPPDETVGLCCAARQSGRAVLNDIAVRLRRRADHIETLNKMLPLELTREQDEALWHASLGMERV